MTKAITLTPLQDVEGVPTAVLQLIEITAIDFFKGDENAPKELCKDPKKTQCEASLIEGS